MHIFLKSQIFRCGQGHTRCGNTFDRRVIGQIDKQYRTVNRTGFLKAFNEEVGFFKSNTHGGKNNGKVFICSENLGLPCNLGCQLGMGQTGCRENRQLLSTNQRVQTIDCRHSRLNKFFRITAGRRIHRQTVNIHAGFRQNIRSIINRRSHTVKHTAKHIFRYAQFHAPSKEAHFAVGQVNPCGTFK